MKKTLGSKLCASVAAAAIFGIAASGSAIAASPYIKLDGGENIYVTSSVKASSSGAATYTASSKILLLKNYTGEDIVTNVPGLKIACASSTNVVKTLDSSSSTTLTTAVTVPASICDSIPNSGTGTDTKNPDTADPLAIYVALFVVAGGALILRRYLAKR